ncbi:uncharacterized protein GLRG_03246 [Colletotrichum graminicola M1.001]|uniref:Uncharacterized protein n=1 Tax=Colletotrichum graminicola (strain M1.001 / M2 / FGSC 10212) TaxID=645133 RepID=E3QB64_COLGM|nr:uncharacterized protein GLRG_03246 [Colletotrichum graminicola M1.001]EFQ28102.1 hypothetical protein GLRG_03246 [Colletotrichum graminicola M1.001]
MTRGFGVHEGGYLLSSFSHLNRRLGWYQVSMSASLTGRPFTVSFFLFPLLSFETVPCSPSWEMHGTHPTGTYRPVVCSRVKRDARGSRQERG